MNPQTHLPHKLHNLSQVFLFLQDLFGFGTQWHKFREVLVVVLVQCSCVLAVTDEPVHWREVLSLSQLFIQTPKHLEVRKNRMITITKKDCLFLFYRTNNVILLWASVLRLLCGKKSTLTCTIPRVADVTGSEKSPPGGDTLQLKQKSFSESVDNAVTTAVVNNKSKLYKSKWLSLKKCLKKHLKKSNRSTYAPTMLTLPSLSGLPRHLTRPARS